MLPYTCKTPTTAEIVKLPDGKFIGPFPDVAAAYVWCQQNGVKGETVEIIDPGFYRQKLDLDAIEDALKMVRASFSEEQRANGLGEADQRLEYAQMALDRITGYFRP